MDILEQRLRTRGTDEDDVIRTRLENARREIVFGRRVLGQVDHRPCRSLGTERGQADLAVVAGAW